MLSIIPSNSQTALQHPNPSRFCPPPCLSVLQTQQSSDVAVCACRSASLLPKGLKSVLVTSAQSVLLSPMGNCPPAGSSRRCRHGGEDRAVVTVTWAQHFVLRAQHSAGCPKWVCLISLFIYLKCVLTTLAKIQLRNKKIKNKKIIIIKKKSSI